MGRCQDCGEKWCVCGQCDECDDKDDYISKLEVGYEKAIDALQRLAHHPGCFGEDAKSVLTELGELDE